MDASLPLGSRLLTNLKAPGLEQRGSGAFFYTLERKVIRVATGKNTGARGLTPKQQRFVEEYLVDLNGTQAATRAGYSRKTAGHIAIELLRNPAIAAALKERRECLSKETGITQKRVLDELAAIAFAKGTDFVSISHGLVHVLDTADMPADKLPAIASIKDGQCGIEVKLHDKVRALELLGKYLALFDNKPTADETKENNLFDAISNAAKEAVDTNDIPELQPEADANADLVEKA